MTVENFVRGRLLAVSGVTDLVGTGNTSRVYFLRLPEGATLPAVTYQRISRAGFPDYDGPEALVSRRVQVDCWASTGKGASDLAEEVRKALDGFEGTQSSVVVLGTFLLDEASEYEVETLLHRVRQDYQVAHRETVAS